MKTYTALFTTLLTVGILSGSAQADDFYPEQVIAKTTVNTAHWKDSDGIRIADVDGKLMLSWAGQVDHITTTTITKEPFEVEVEEGEGHRVNRKVEDLIHLMSVLNHGS